MPYASFMFNYTDCLTPFTNRLLPKKKKLALLMQSHRQITAGLRPLEVSNSRTIKIDKEEV